MKKVLLLFTAVFLNCCFALAQYQLSNGGFENWPGSETSIPPSWHSFSDANCALTGFEALGCSAAKTNHHFRSSYKHSGDYSCCIYSKEVGLMGITKLANGNFTTGRVRLGTSNAGNTAENYNYTENGYKHTFSGYPDSIRFWASFYATGNQANQGANAYARVSVIIYNSTNNGNDMRDPVPATSAFQNRLVAALEKEFPRTTSNANNLNWQCFTKEFDYNVEKPENSAAYILLTITNNKVPVSGTEDDRLYIDDIEMVYNGYLTEIQTNGTPISSFNRNTFDYYVDCCVGAIPEVSATAESSIANSKNQVSITQADENNNYTATINRLGSDITYRVHFNLIPAPAAPTITSTPICAPVAQNVTMSAYSEGATNYRWYTTESGSSYTEGSSFTEYNLLGSVTYYVSALNDAGCESSRTPATAIVAANPAAPTAASTTSVCSGSTGTFTATPPTGENITCRWYATNNSSEVLGTGTSLEIANLSQNTTRYASSYNTASGCESSDRVAVTVNVNSLPAAPTALTGGSHCGTGTVSLSATPATGTSCQWFAAETGGEPLATGNSYTTTTIENTTTYYVASYNNTTGCSSARQGVVATINPIPDNPEVSGNEAICAGTTITLTASAGNNADAVKWYGSNNQLLGENNSFTTPVLEQNASYTVKSYNTTTECLSNGLAVNVIVNQLPDAPSLSDNSRCGSGNITLEVNNPDNNATYTWYNANNVQVNTGATYAIQNLENTSNYYVTSTVNGCTGASASVTATIHPIPGLPAVTEGSHCGEGTVTLSASAGQNGNQVHWFASMDSEDVLSAENSYETTTINTTTIYYVASYNSNTQCIGTRQEVTATIHEIPAAPTATGDTLCGSGQAVLTAIPAENCSCQWFNANNYTEINTGISDGTKKLTTINLSQSTIYHVRSINVNTQCTSDYTDIQVLVAPIPGAPTVSNNARCGAGSISLTATPGNNANTCRWYNANNEFLYEGISYEIVNLEETSSFYCKSYNSNTACESGSRMAIATINSIPQQPTVQGNMPICGSGSLTLTGTPGANAAICRWINGNDTTTSNTFSTGNISQSTDYLVQSYNANTHCASENLEVNVVVNSLPATPQTVNDTQCLGSEVNLTAVASENTIVRWYTSAQDNNILFEGSAFHPTNLVVGENNFYASLYDTLTQCTSAERGIATATMIDAPAIPNVADTAHCGPASFSLNIINAQNNTIYKWYANAQGGEPIHTGTSFTTGELNATTHYHVSATVDGYDCESGRKDVTITINPIPANPVINGNEAICAGNTLSVSASSDAAATNFVWSDGQSAIEGENFTTPTLSENTSFTVKAYNADTHCESELVNFTVTVNPNPAIPVVTSDTSCQNEAVTLSASASSDNTCYWYASEDADTALANGDSYNPTDLAVGTTNFHVSQRNNGTGCESERTVVYAVVHPIYAVDYPIVACDSFVWNNETFKTSGDYERTLSSQYGCDSVVTLQLTINHSKITNIDTTVCDMFVWNNQTYETSGDYQQTFSTTQNCDSTVNVHLTVKKSTTGSDHIYLCSNQLPYDYNGLLSVTAAGTYTIHTDNMAGCDSTITLTVTVNTQPAIATNLTPAARCGEGSVTLTAHAGQNGTTCRWYISEDATEALATGTQYTTGNLSSTTTFYVSSYNDYNGHPCESSRQAIAATINAIPAEPTVADQVRCGNGEVELSATVDENANTCRWYPTLNANASLATGLTYTPTISTSATNGITYYVESYNTTTNCKSSRKAVKATAFTIPSVPVLAPMSYCGEHQFSIDAPTSGYYKWYENAESENALNITNNTTPNIDASRSYFISHAMNYAGISCESDKAELALTIYPVYAPQNIYDTICQGETYTQYGLNETFADAGSFDRVINTVSSTNCDSLVNLKLTVKEIRYHEFSVTECDSYTWNEESFTESADIVRPFTSSIGCDSVVTLHLTINHSRETEFTATECDSYTWNDETYNTSGNYVQHFQTVNGCDSTVTLHLTINHSVTTEFSEIACDSYTWNNETYTESGDKVQHFQTSKGCDSTVTLHLTINYSNAAALTDAVCAGEQYHANGFDTIFNQAGVYTLIRHDLNQAGCDSTTTLTLTVNPVYQKDVNMTICETALPYTWNDITYPEGTASGEYQHIYNGQTAAGCDSIVTLNLTISNQYITNLSEHICQGENFYFDGKELNQTGIYHDTVLAQNLCDSIIILNLTVHQLNTTILNETICLGETYSANGFNETPTESGLKTYQKVVQTPFGCDSTVILNLTVNPTFFEEMTENSCDNAEFVWQGHEHINIGIKKAGEYTIWDSLKTINGCDSVYKLTLTVNPTFYEENEDHSCDNEAYVWQGHEHINIGIKNAGEYTIWDSLTTINGCDSVYKLTLTVTPTFYEENEDNTCDNEAYVWQGHEYLYIGLLDAGEHIIWDSLTTVNGCDSVYKLTLTVTPTFYAENEANTCDNEAYVWPGHEYVNIGIREAGEYIIWDSLKTINDCDSIYKLTLIVTPTFYAENEANTCDNEAYVWPGHEHINIGIKEAGEYIIWDSLSTAHGCDSIYKLNLTVNETKQTDLYKSICFGDYYEYNNTYYEENGDYDIHFQTVLGCDSTVTLHLTVNPVYSIDTNINVCQGSLPYVFADTIFNASGYKDIMLHTQNGCDSIYHVHLTVTPFITRSETVTICHNELPYTYLDSTFNEAGIYEVTETFADGCNRITTLTLIVNPTYDTTVYVTACGSYILDRITYQRELSESGIYTDTLHSIHGCDSVVHLNLTINPLKDTLLTPVICQGESYVENGFNLTPENAGMVYDTLHLSCIETGCDSTVYLELTVNPSYNHSFDTTVCDEFVWNEQTYTESDVISHTYVLATGCDSTVTYNLTVNPSYNHVFDTTVCDLFVWNGQSYSESETISHTYVLATGCDSTVTYNLTVNHSKETMLTPAICQGDSYMENGFNLTPENAGVVYDTLHLQCVGTGCDSTVYLALTVNPSYNHSFDTTVCDQFVWNDQEYTESEVISHTYVLATGCDSTVTYNLTVNPSYNHTFDTIVCDQFVWNDHTYTASEIISHTYVLVTGCDSTVTYNLTVNHSVTENQTITICQSELPYTWRDQNFGIETTVGVHNFTYELETSKGCDSIVNLTLTINPNNEYYDNPITFCEGGSYEWNGQIITESGIYTDTVPNNYGCYDVYKVVVTVNPVYSFVEYDTVCSNALPITWQGRQITQAGTHFADYQTSTGCDSLYQLILTVTPSYYLPAETATICDNEEYVWDGHEYITIGQRVAGTYTIYDSLSTAMYGCDSVHTLILTVTPTYNFQPEHAVVCDNEEYVWEGHNVQIGQRAAGTYTIYDSLSTATYACDSVHTLMLTVTPTYNFQPEHATVCDNEEYVWEGHEYITIGQRTAGTYTIYDSLSTTSFGCDSVYTLILTVNATKHSIENAEACSNENVFSWHNRNITATGVYYDTLTTSLGCDSVCELRFTLLEPTMAVFADTTCANALYQAYGFEITPIQSGDTVIERITENAAGCDSTITVNLYVKPIANFTIDTIVCGALNMNNQWYVESGTFYQTLTAANGCDSILTINLTIDTPSRDTVEVTACGSYEWDGTIYTQTGTYSKVYPQPVGCDSIAVLDLTINYSTEVTLYDTTCLASLYQEYGFDTLVSQMGTLNLHRVDVNAAGCDSIINLVLTVHRTYMQIDSASTCDNEEFIWEGINCDTTGVYTRVYPTVHGCDSIFVLFLTVNPSYETDVTDTAIAGIQYHNHGLSFTPQTPGTLHIDVPRTTVDGCDSLIHVTLIVKDGNSIDMHYLDKQITLYPNPTENVFNVNSTADIIRELTIYDNNGRAIWRQEVNDYDAQVNVENLAPGIYFVRLTMPNNIVTKKLIVR